MKEYKFVYLNRGLKMNRDKDLETCDEVTNKMIAEGWELHSVISPNDIMGVIVGVFYKEKDVFSK